MAKLTNEEKTIFPLNNIESVVKLFKVHLEKNSQPNLAILSTIVGYVENTLTCSRPSSIPIPPSDNAKNEQSRDCLKTHLPTVDYEDVEALHQRFLSIILAHVDVTTFGSPKYATRELVKRVSDVVWCTLCGSYYKDRAHLQSMYSYMAGAKLDSSGTTLAVVAAFQALGYNDVHLALSEDHTWIICGENGEITVEVTWHGKGNEDKRGVPVTEDVYVKSWLYVNGRPVVCTRHMEVATIISNMNPGINSCTDSEEVILLQQALLWLLYDQGYLAKYPMAIDNLADLEEMTATSGRPPATKLYEEAILSNIRYYNNQHVYPYTYLGGYCYRNKIYKLALKAWAKAAFVIKNYNYSRDDEEIYKEFLEIATDLIPHILRVVSSGHSAKSIVRDPDCFGFLLEFYDGICNWEEGSPTPVLHVGWAKALISALSKFDSTVRSLVKIVCPHQGEGDSESGKIGIIEESNAETISSRDQNGNMALSFPSLDSEDCEIPALERRPIVELYSAKMRGLADLLLADKLNSGAMSLQLTAQSQVTLAKKRTGNADIEQSCGRPKRYRRE